MKKWKLYAGLFLLGFAYEFYFVLFLYLAHANQKVTATLITFGFYFSNELVWVKFLKSDWDWKAILFHNFGYALSTYVSLSFFPLNL